MHESKKSLINQREVHRDTHSFNNALRSALREDPDIILVGELRDLETIRLALTAAETGHLVFGTLHTTSAANTIDRIVDVFPAEEKDMVRAMLSESLQAVVSQTLLKKIGGGRVAEWMKQFGDPRDPQVDPIDWNERIPFTETRQYVVKIMETLQLYRSRLAGPKQALQLVQDLNRGRRIPRAEAAIAVQAKSE